MKKILYLAIFFIFIFGNSTAQDENSLDLESRGMVNIGLTEKNRETIAEELNNLLANEYMLYTKTLNYHWNVKGKFFGPLHMLFKNQYEQLFKFIDRIAERSLALGFEAKGSLKEFLQNSTLKQSEKNPDEKEMLENLLEDHEIIIQQIRKIAQLSEELNDWGTNNLTGELIEQHEKIAWMLRAHLQK